MHDVNIEVEREDVVEFYYTILAFFLLLQLRTKNPTYTHHLFSTHKTHVTQFPLFMDTHFLKGHRTTMVGKANMGLLLS